MQAYLFGVSKLLNNSISLGSWLRGMCTHKGERKQLNKYESKIRMSFLRNTQ
jgi:hypothetical protein